MLRSAVLNFALAVVLLEAAGLDFAGLSDDLFGLGAGAARDDLVLLGGCLRVVRQLAVDPQLCFQCRKTHTVHQAYSYQAHSFIILIHVACFYFISYI